MSFPLCSSTMTNSLQKSPFISLTKCNNLNGFRCNHHLLQFRSSITRIQPYSSAVNFSGTSIKQQPLLGFSSLQRNLGFSIGAENGDGGGGETKKEVVDELEEARKESSMPEQFKLKMDETPDPPLIWPWLIALPLLVYTWRMVLWELSNWKNFVAGALRPVIVPVVAVIKGIVGGVMGVGNVVGLVGGVVGNVMGLVGGVVGNVVGLVGGVVRNIVGLVGGVVGLVVEVVMGVVGVVAEVVMGVATSVIMNVVMGVVTVFHDIGTLLELALAGVLYFFGNPLTVIARFIGASVYTLSAIYSSIVTSAPVQELTVIIVLTSIVLAIAEAVVPDSVDSQPYLLTVAGIVGFATVKSIIPEPLFWVFLVGFFCYSRYVKKRDDVSSALPSAAVLTAVGAPWVRLLVMGSYTTLAIYQHSKKLSEENEKVEVTTSMRRAPLPLQAAALAIGIHVAAKWLRYQHLKWMSL